jgi:hypothetical protein
VPRIVLRTSRTSQGLSRIVPNDITHWEEIGFEAGGAREKKILRHPGSKKWYLIKFPKYGDFEIQTEVFNSVLAHELEINHVQYYRIKYGNKLGVCCKGFLELDSRLEELWEMRELICHHSKIASTEKKFGRDADVLKEHNIDNIFLILETEFESSVLRSFFQMVGLDALIGHGDRHWSNYGVVVSSKNGNIRAKFAPIYDTASGYLTEIGDSERLMRMLGSDLLNDEWYKPGNKQELCKITVPNNIKSNHFDLMKRILSEPQLMKYKDDLAKPFRLYNRQLTTAILKRFFPELSELKKDVICTILNKRHSLGCELLGL